MSAERPERATHDDIRLIEHRRWYRRQRQYECGHRGPRYEIDAYGAILDPVGTTKCGTCAMEELKRVSARCAVCGFAILPNAPVAAFILTPEAERDLPAYTRITLADGKQPEFLVGLCTLDCALGCEIHGWWKGDGTYHSCAGRDVATMTFREWSALRSSAPPLIA